MQNSYNEAHLPAICDAIRYGALSLRLIGHFFTEARPLLYLGGQDCNTDSQEFAALMHEEDQVVLPDGAGQILKREAEALRGPMVDFAQRLIRTPSLPGQEGEVARIVLAEMEALGYDEAQIDHAGNVVGLVRATSIDSTRPARSIMFNTHMDHVDVGDHSRWPFPPYAATVRDGELWGRGASDLKGSLATQVYSPVLIKRSGLPLPNSVYVVGVVQEEVSGLGSAELANYLKTDYIVIGEPSDNQIALGHRGRTEIWVTITGKSVHASVPGTGVNPLYSLSRFLLALEQMQFEVDPTYPELGPTTVAPTLISTDQTSANVVPGEVKLVIDFRNSPADTPSKLLAQVREILRSSLENGATATAEIVAKPLTSYTGVSRAISNAAPAFGVVPGSRLLTAAKAGVAQALGREIPTKIWPFATDAGHFVAPGVDIIGFGPGREEVIHTVEERISIDQMVEALIANAAIALTVS